MLENTNVLKEIYKPGEYIFFEGDLDFHFYIVESGEIRIFKKDTHGKKVDIAVVKAGESFGEFAFLERKPRSATAQALTEVALVRISEKGYQQLLAELPGWASSMLQSFAGRIRHTNELLAELGKPAKT
jgi:CRP/FNR family transcriptional regulator, cyclic AMP receptor protein